MSEASNDIDLVQLSNRLAELEAKVNKPPKQSKKRFYCIAEVDENTKLTMAEIAEAQGTFTSKLLAKLIEEYIFNQSEPRLKSNTITKELDW
ncbi:MAG: hypothetical protein P2A85_09115 [Microcoleus anatoxicus]|uniref:hypothetical protein n=1 Tax=Microcoleus anatoxicus TaxID=2705319 RepID=UPI00366C0045